jgi:hypothetical protein
MLRTLAMTKLKSHWVMRAAAIVRDRMWLGFCGVSHWLCGWYGLPVKTYGTLGAQNEWDRAPSERIEDDKEVNADDRERRVAVK